MAKQGQTALGGGLDAIVATAKSQGGRALPPVHQWNPPYCGDIAMRIAGDGTWYYQDTPIGRPALVKLFASVLKREGERYFLVTPVEKCGLVVEDAPFLAVEMLVDVGIDPAAADAPVLRFRTNVDDWVDCGHAHALRFEHDKRTGGLTPYLHVRRELWAKVTRALFYDIVDRGEEREIDGTRVFGVASGGAFFAMAAAETLGGANV